MKCCSRCKVEKDESEYHKQSSAFDGHCPVCKKCRSDYYLGKLFPKRTVKKCSKCLANKQIHEFTGRTGKLTYSWCEACRNDIAQRALNQGAEENGIVKRRLCTTRNNRLSGFYTRTRVRARYAIADYQKYLREVCSDGYIRQLISGGDKALRKFIPPELVLAHRENLLLKRELRKLNSTIKEMQK